MAGYFDRKLMLHEETALSITTHDGDERKEPILDQTTLNLIVRAELDAVRDILGENAAAIVYREADLSDVYKNPPAYDFEPGLTRAQRARLYREIADLVGLNGAVGVWRRLGYAATMCSDEIGGAMSYVQGANQEERFISALELYSRTMGTGRIVTDGADGVGFDLAECFTCRGYQSTRPICSLAAGSIQYMADVIFGKKKFQVEEKTCKAMGGETCYYVLKNC